MTHTADNTNRQETAMRPHPDATPLRQPTWTIQPPVAAAEHPVRCPARLSFAVIGDHTHECIQPAPTATTPPGLLEHTCHCGATWSERSSVGGTTTSSEEQAHG